MGQFQAPLKALPGFVKRAADGRVAFLHAKQTSSFGGRAKKPPGLADLSRPSSREAAAAATATIGFRYALLSSWEGGVCLGEGGAPTEGRARSGDRAGGRGAGGGWRVEGAPGARESSRSEVLAEPRLGSFASPFKPSPLLWCGSDEVSWLGLIGGRIRLDPGLLYCDILAGKTLGLP